MQCMVGMWNVPPADVKEVSSALALNRANIVKKKLQGYRELIW